MKERCPICRSSQSESVYDANSQPLLLNHLCSTRAEAMNAPRGNLAFRGCSDCSFVWNAAFDANSVVYGPGYVNDQSQSGVFRGHLNSVMQRLQRLIDRVPGAIVEVGCGQGGFLRALCGATKRNGIGFDPALSSAGSSSVQLRRACFDERSLGDVREPIALVYSRHVLEHLVDPTSMVRAMAAAIADRPGAALYLEVPTFEWIAEQRAFFDLFNEHCSLFSAASMQRMLRDAGLAHCHVESVFDGQYLAATTCDAARPLPASATNWSSARSQLARERERIRARFDELLAAGQVFIWGGAAKGVSVVNQLGINFERLPHLIDINPGKQGRFVPGTGQQIIGPNDLGATIARGSLPTIVIMNPNYEHEIARQLVELGISAHLEVIGASVDLEVHR